MNSTVPDAHVISYQATAASYLSHTGVETAVRSLAAGGLAIPTITIIGLDYVTRVRFRGLYSLADAALITTTHRVWFDGLLEILQCDVGFFYDPTVGQFLVMGRLSRTIAAATEVSDGDSLIDGLTATGVAKDHAGMYQSRVRTGEFLVLVHGDVGEVMRGHKILGNTAPLRLKTHWATMDTLGNAVSLGPKCGN